MNKTSLLTFAAVLATSAVLCESSRAAVHNEPDLGNSLEQRIERMSTEAWAVMQRNGVLTDEQIERYESTIRELMEPGLVRWMLREEGSLDPKAL